MSSLKRKLRRNKAKKDFKNNNQDLSFSDYWKLREGKPITPKKNNKQVEYTELVYRESQPEPQLSEKELEQEKKRQESIETGKSFLKGLDIFNKKVEDIKAHDEHGEHD